MGLARQIFIITAKDLRAFLEENKQKLKLKES